MTQKRKPAAIQAADELCESIPGYPEPTRLELAAADILRTQYAALQEWMDKTLWVEETLQLKELGMHYADIMRTRLDARDARIAELEAELAAAKAPAPIPSNSVELDPSTPWYPDDSGEWVEVPEDLMEMPSALSPETRIEGLTRDEREGELYTYCNAHAKHWPWFLESHSDNRIVAYKVVKP